MDFFRGLRPWTQLHRLIDGLPVHSRYVAALLDDPDTARELAALPEQATPDLSMAGFDPHRALLSALLDAINQNTAATIAVAGADPPTFQPSPRPVTELDRQRERLRHQSRRALAALALGKDINDID